MAIEDLFHMKWNASQTHTWTQCNRLTFFGIYSQVLIGKPLLSNFNRLKWRVQMGDCIWNVNMRGKNKHKLYTFFSYPFECTHAHTQCIHFNGENKILRNFPPFLLFLSHTKCILCNIQIDPKRLFMHSSIEPFKRIESIG